MSSPDEHDAIRTREDYRAFLNADLRAHGVDRWRLRYVLTKPTLRYQRLLRKVEYLRSLDGLVARAGYAAARLRLARLSVRTGISIPPGVFGRGLSIAHYGSIVVNDEARVGRYCRIHSATNIGTYAGAAPRIGDFAYIGPGAVIYGAVVLGDDIAVGANAVVGSSFTGPATLAGAPARVVSTTGSSSAMPQWMPSSRPEEHRAE